MWDMAKRRMGNELMKYEKDMKGKKLPDTNL